MFWLVWASAQWEVALWGGCCCCCCCCWQVAQGKICKNKKKVYVKFLWKLWRQLNKSFLLLLLLSVVTILHHKRRKYILAVPIFMNVFPFMSSTNTKAAKTEPERLRGIHKELAVSHFILNPVDYLFFLQNKKSVLKPYTNCDISDSVKGENYFTWKWENNQCHGWV